jgi:hypothetical protein
MSCPWVKAAMASWYRVQLASGDGFEHGAEAGDYSICASIAPAARLRRLVPKVHEMMLSQCEWCVMERGAYGF